MSSWNEEDCWSDGDELPAFESIRSQRPRSEDEHETAPPLLTLEEAFLGSVYWIADILWKIPVSDRQAHPGVCVRCDSNNQQAVLLKGTSFRKDCAWRYERPEMLVVEPTAENGLHHATAFALDPRLLSLRILRRIHLDEGPRGRLSQEVLWRMEARLADLERALTEGVP
jgi:hypothetical protein